MGSRTHSLLLGLGFGGGGLCILLAVLMGIGIFRSDGGMAPILTMGIVLVGMGIVSQQLIDRLQSKIIRSNAAIQELEERLEQQRRAVDALADGLEVGIIVCDQKAQILYANRVSIQLFNFENPIRKTVLQMSLSYELEQFVLSVSQSNIANRIELNLSYPRERSVIATAWPDREGGRMFLSIYDITELRKLERIRQDFVANVSHELRTPLASIRAMAETLVDEKGEDKELEERYLNRIITEIDRLSLLSNDLLLLSAAESTPIRKQASDIAQVVTSVKQQVESQAKKKGLKLSYEGPAHLLMEANTSQLTQIIINLVENAINYTSEGEVKIEIKDLGEEVQLVVSDTGIGIANDHQSRIFERFYRVDKARSRKVGGTGLGLSIVKHLAESHGGSIQVESTLGQGSKFTVTLPKGVLNSESV